MNADMFCHAERGIYLISLTLRSAATLAQVSPPSLIS